MGDCNHNATAKAANNLDVTLCCGLSPNTDDTDERTSSAGAIYTLVRASSSGATRPFTTAGSPCGMEMQSGNVEHRIALTRQHPATRTTRAPAKAWKLKARASSGRYWREVSCGA